MPSGKSNKRKAQEIDRHDRREKFLKEHKGISRYQLKKLQQKGVDTSQYGGA